MDINFDAKSNTSRYLEWLHTRVGRGISAHSLDLLSCSLHFYVFQWFGDLVTMRWWDDLWLNEGFTRFVEDMGADFIHPDWKMVRTQFMGQGKLYAFI